MSFNLDDLLNDALDELEVQENEKVTNNASAVSSTTSATSTTSTTSTATVTTDITNQNNNNNNNNNDPNNTILNDLQNMFSDKSLKDLFNISQSEKDQMPNELQELLNNMKQMTAELEKAGPSIDGTTDYDKSADSFLNEMNDAEKKEFAAQIEKMSSMFGGFDPSNLNNQPNLNNNNNNNNTNNTNVDIKDFENNVSNILKGLANNAATQPPSSTSSSTSSNPFASMFGSGGLGGSGSGGGNEEEMMKQMMAMMAGGNGGSGGDGGLGELDDTINEFYETSMKYIVEHYPKWIEQNKDKYPADEVTKMQEQCNTFIKLYQTDESAMGSEDMIQKVSLMGNLPEAFCDQYVKDIQESLNL